MSGEVLDDLLATAEHATIVLSAEGTVVAFNENARKLVAPAFRDLKGRHLPDICTGHLSHFGNLVASAMESGEAMTKRDVAMGDAACKLDVRRGGRHWVVRIRDVTEQLANLYRLREAEAEKEEMRELMMTALNGVSVGIVVVNADRRPIYVNRYARKFIGDLMERTSMEDLAPGLGLYESDGVTLREPHRQSLLRALKGETVMGEELVLRNDLTERALRILANAGPFYDRDGRIAGAVSWCYLLDQLTDNTEPACPDDSAEIIQLMFRPDRL